MNNLAIATIFSIVETFSLAKTLRMRRNTYVCISLFMIQVVPIVALILINLKFVIVGWHEFMHASIVFNIINEGVPPEDVLLAGHPLKYPWIHHYIVAILGLSPL
jgi:hypothetical protein